MEKEEKVASLKKEYNIELESYEAMKQIKSQFSNVLETYKNCVKGRETDKLIYNMKEDILVKLDTATDKLEAGYKNLKRQINEIQDNYEEKKNEDN